MIIDVECPECGELITVAPEDEEVTCGNCEAGFKVARDGEGVTLI